MDSDVAVYGKAMRSVTYYLGSHPLREWLETAVEAHGGVDEPTSKMATTPTNEPTINESANKQLRRLLGMPVNTANLMPKKLEVTLPPLGEERVKQILIEMHDTHPETEALRRLNAAYSKVFKNSSRSS